jgi:uncharacterized protein DUF1566
MIAYVFSLKSQAPFVLVAFAIATSYAGAQSPVNVPTAQTTQANVVWADPFTNLIWAARDNGKDVSWKGAAKYCHNLRLAGYSDWRLANMAELQGIHDKTANAPGLAGRHDDDPTMWHVRGNLFLTGDQWSANDRLDDRGHHSGYAYYFDFNEGKPNDDPTGWPYPYSFRRALCVRGTGDPLGWQRRRLQSD